MLITEESFKNAFRKFWGEIKIPRPAYWTKELDKGFVRDIALPSFLEALKEIEDVNLCDDFDMDNIDIYD